MRKILALEEKHIEEYRDIAYNAYPSFKALEKEAIEEYEKITLETMKNDPDVRFYGMFEGGKLIAVMRLFDFQMNSFGKILPASGLGFLGVHLMHKKERAAKAMIEFYEEDYRKKGIPIASLLPFRPDFYKKMGYGIGTKVSQYRLPPNRIPAYYGDSDLRYIGDDFQKLLDCHRRVTEKTHGMIRKIQDEIRDLKNNPYNKIVGAYNDQEEIEAYMVFEFQNAKADNYTINNIYIKELVYENTEALKKLLGFLRKQEDQVSLVIFNTMDDDFHYLFPNPLNDSLNYIAHGFLESNTQAVGIMYKILDVKEAFRQMKHRDYNGVSMDIRFLILDELRDQEEEIILRLRDGVAKLHRGEYQGTVRIKLADFSSLFMGAASAKGLYDLGILELDNKELLRDLDLAFYTNNKPVCYTDF